MKEFRLLVFLVLVGASASVGQEGATPLPLATPATRVMLAAVSRDESMLAGGIGSSKWTAPGTVVVEPLAFVTESGQWSSLPCVGGTEKNCAKFEHDYLSKSHSYTVVSTDGRGATVRARPTTLSECFDYSGKGTYSGGVIKKAAIAARSNELFVDSDAPRLLSKKETFAIDTLITRIPKKLDSTSYLRVFSVRLEGQDFYIVQRAFGDIPKKDEKDERLSLIFGVGAVEPNRFEILHWKQNTEDEDEQVLGTIRLKSGSDYLITVVSDPESHSYHVYGVRAGKLKLIYSGGGSSC